MDSGHHEVPTAFAENGHGHGPQHRFGGLDLNLDSALDFGSSLSSNLASKIGNAPSLPQKERLAAAASWASEWIQQHSRTRPRLRKDHPNAGRTAYSRQRAVPQNIDLIYVTDRLISASAPSKPLHATYHDTGRDGEDSEHELKPAQFASMAMHVAATSRPIVMSSSAPKADRRSVQDTERATADPPSAEGTTPATQTATEPIMENPQEGGDDHSVQERPATHHSAQAEGSSCDASSHDKDETKGPSDPVFIPVAMPLPALPNETIERGFSMQIQAEAIKLPLPVTPDSSMIEDDNSKEASATPSTSQPDSSPSLSGIEIVSSVPSNDVESDCANSQAVSNNSEDASPVPAPLQTDVSTSSRSKSTESSNNMENSAQQIMDAPTSPAPPMQHMAKYPPAHQDFALDDLLETAKATSLPTTHGRQNEAAMYPPQTDQHATACEDQLRLAKEAALPALHESSHHGSSKAAEGGQPQQENGNEIQPSSSATIDSIKSQPPTPSQPSHITDPKDQNSSTAKKPRPNTSTPSALPHRIFNSAANMSSFLEQQHGLGHFMALGLTNDPPDDRFLTIWRRQVVHVGWASPCPERSEIPTIPHLLKICWMIHAYLSSNRNNVMTIYCANGKTRTSIVLGCYLKFCGRMQTTMDGFIHSLRQRGVEDPVHRVVPHLPPSLLLFMQHFDETINMGCVLNRKPLLLRAIAIQGVPVEDKPCLDIWDSSQDDAQPGKHVYSSHPEMWTKADADSSNANEPATDQNEGSNDKARANTNGITSIDVKNNANISSSNTSNKPKRTEPTSQWADEEGFYKVNKVVEGDFVLLCRFGGDYAKETTIHDPSKILFRYASTTAYLAGGGPLELSSQHVDLMKRYRTSLQNDDFLITFLWEAHWETKLNHNNDISDALQQRLRTDSDRLLPTAGSRVFDRDDPRTIEEGWKLIFRHHCARPETIDHARFVRYCPRYASCPKQVLSICLQLANFDLELASRALQSQNWRVFDWNSMTSTRASLTQGGDQIADHDARNEEKDAAPFDNDREGGKPTADPTANGNTTQDDDQAKPASQPMNDDIFALLDQVNAELGIDGGHSQSGEAAVEDTATSSAAGSKSLTIRDQHNDVQRFTLCLPPMHYPQAGDIVGAFGPYHKQMQRPEYDNLQIDNGDAHDQPQLPFFSRRHPNMFPAIYLQQPDSQERTDPDLNNHIPRYNADEETAIDIFMKINHTGVSFDEIRDMIQESRKWTGYDILEPDPMEEEEEGEADPTEEEATGNAAKSANSMNKEAKKSQQKKWEDAKKAEAKEKEEKKKQEADAKQKKEAEEKAKAKPAEEGEKKEGEGEDEKSATGDDVPLKDDPEYAKYFKMLKMGMQKEQVMHAFQRDGKDPKVLDMDPNKSLKSQLPKDDVPIKDDPDYEKYFKMLKMGLPIGAVKNALSRDGKDPSVMDLDPNKSLKSQRKPAAATGGDDEDDGPALKDDPEYAKYFKMLGMGLPKGAVQNALTRDGKDPSIMDLDPNKSVKSQLKKDDEADTGPPLKDDPEYAKYFKMLGMGLPKGAVQNALTRDGKDPSIMDLDPNKSVKSQMGGSEEKDTGIPLKDDPDYTKYFKMLTMGLPMGAVKNALERDGKNAAVMDMDPSKSVAFQLAKKGSGAAKKPSKKKKRVRRKKIYWTPIDENKIEEDSMWNIVRGKFRMNELSYDAKEFEDLFTESADPGQKKKKKASSSSAKKSVQVIDGKRSMNGGIILARLKMDYTKISQIVDKMEHGKFDATQLKALKEFLADADERRGLVAYMKKGDSSEEAKAKAMADLSEAEKYMVTMMVVKDPGKKFDAMLFRTIFKSRFEEMKTDIKTLNQACDEVRSSQRLRKLMAMILTVVNEINTGGEGKMAIGFTLDALLKLNEAKAFDKKTSVLHYLAKLVKKNDIELLRFDSDLKNVIAAENVVMDGLSADVKLLLEDLGPVHETVKEEADRLEKTGELRPMSLGELKEQVTVVQNVEGVQQFNKVDHKSGRTSMERFTVNAQTAAEQAADSIQKVKKKYQKLLGYFGEDDKMPSTDFFGTLRRFMTAWQQAIEQVEAIEKAAAKEKKKAEKRAAKEAAKAAKAAGKGTKPDKASTAKSAPMDPKAALAAAIVAKGKGGGPSDKKQAAAKPQGIGALAAAAALKKKPKRDEKAIGDSKPQGIGALAAAAALKKSSSKGSDKPKERSRSALEDALIGHKAADEPTGIAAFASAAAVLKAKSTQYDEKGELISNRDDENVSESVKSFAAKAAAYRKKRGKKDDKDGDTGSSRHSRTAFDLDDDMPDSQHKNLRFAGSMHGTPGRRNEAPGTSNADHAANTAESKSTPSLSTPSRNRDDDGARQGTPEGSKFLSSAARYRRKKSQRKLSVGGDGIGNDDVANAAKEATKQQQQQIDEAHAGGKSNAKAPGAPAALTEAVSSPKMTVDEPISELISPLRSPSRAVESRKLAGSSNASQNGNGAIIANSPVDGLASLPTLQKPSKGGLDFPVQSAKSKKGPSLSSFLAQNSRPRHKSSGGSNESPTSANGQEPGPRPKPLAVFLNQAQDVDDDASLVSYDPRFKNFDDSSVANFTVSTETDENRGKAGGQNSSAWKQGDTIANWSTWATQLVNDSDTQSVANFEAGRDLADPNDFDDDSTIATTTTYMDDMNMDGESSYNYRQTQYQYSGQNEYAGQQSVGISDYFQPQPLPPSNDDPYAYDDGRNSEPTTPSGNIHKIAKSILQDDTSSQGSGPPIVTPAKVAASILFTDSPASSTGYAPGQEDLAGAYQGDEEQEQYTSMEAAAVYYGDAGLDAGLSFGAPANPGLDDGLMAFGETTDMDAVGAGIDMPSLADASSSQHQGGDKKKSWLPWG